MSALVKQNMGDAQFEAELLSDIAEFYDDPLAYVMYAFPWGKKGSLLEDFDGPDVWQAQQLDYIGQRFRDDPEATIRDCTASGHGIGKSTECAWIILWAMSTRPHLNGVVTANTTTQLNTKTWRELAYWHKMAINEHWFKWTATKFFHLEHSSTWFVAAVPNTEQNSEAFAGLHARHVLVIYDEASGIPDKIWEVSEGAMTTPRAIWIAFGNPTRNTGRFVDCFTTDSERWNTRQIDSRSCKMTNKKEIAAWVKSYGEDSDFIRVRVRGVFPRAGNMQFISTQSVDMAMARDLEMETYIHLPIIIGVDVARYGDDKSVICIRQGRKILEMRKFRELNTMALSLEVARAIKEFQPGITFVDGVGVGGGVVDRLRQLGYEIIEVNAGVKPDDDELYFNKRIEMWDRMKRWINSADIPMTYNGSIDGDTRKSLIGIEYGFSDSRQKNGDTIRLEKKADMKKRGEASPDEGDAIAMTFAEIIGDLKKQWFEPSDSFEPEAA